MKAIDITGQKFGRLTVLKRCGSTGDGKASWLCVCDCGAEVILDGKRLRSGHTTSCGCFARESTSARSLNDLSGNRFGSLLVVERDTDYISPSGRRLVKWVCRCDCGNTTSVMASQLVTGKTKSCGCLHRSILERGNVKHGCSEDRLYKTYYNMRNRCYNENSQDYKYYGKRGIYICDEWLNDYMSFKSWAYQNGYDENAEFGECTIDRIDVDGPYCPENCRFVDMKIQSQNRRNVKNNDKHPRKNNDRTQTEVSGTAIGDR